MATAAPVLVTGATGFVASHLIRALLMRGQKVRGTMRSVSNAKKINEVRSVCPEQSHNLDFVEADLTDAQSWYSAVQGMEYVYHVASPLHMDTPKHEDDLIKPAVEGTLNVLRACRDSGVVKRCVITSTMACIMDTNAGDKVLDENSWPIPVDTGAYIKSKILAEKAAWKFMKEEQANFEMAVVNPGYIVGPALYKQKNVMGQLIQQIMEREMSRVPQLYIYPIDVRVLAEAHIAAMNVPEAAGHRHAVVDTKAVPMSELALMLEKEFKPMGYDVATKEMPSFIIKFFALFNAQARTMKPLLGRTFNFDNSRAKRVLGLKVEDITDCVLETAHSLIEVGLIKKTAKYKPRQK